MTILTINTGVKAFLNLSIEGSLILDRLEYWWKKMKRPFYKYLSPVDGKTHGDSWEEEITLSKHRFNKAFKELGKKYSSMTAFKTTPDHLKFVEDGEEKLYASVFCPRTNQTYYYRNTEKVISVLDAVGETSKQYLRDEDDLLIDNIDVECVENGTKPGVESQEKNNIQIAEPNPEADGDFLDLTGVSFAKGKMVDAKESSDKDDIQSGDDSTITEDELSIISLDDKSNDNSDNNLGNESKIQQIKEHESDILDIELVDVDSHMNEPETSPNIDTDSYTDDILNDNNKPLFLSQKEEMAFYLFLRDIQMISNQKLNIGRASTFAGSDLNQLKSRNSKKPRYWNVVSYYKLWVSRGREMTFKETQAYINTSYKDYKSSIESEKLQKISEEALLENGKYDMNKLVL
jgi:hypothetical protein